jgi:hypothetical protein
VGLVDSLHPGARLGSGNVLDALCETPGCGRCFLVITDAVAEPDYLRFDLSAGDRERSPILLPAENLAKASSNSRPP